MQFGITPKKLPFPRKNLIEVMTVTALGNDSTACKYYLDQPQVSATHF